MFPELKYFFNQLAPFLAFYGPMAYFMILAYDDHQILPKKVALHLALPILLLIIFIIILFCNSSGVANFDPDYLLPFKVASIGSTFFYTVLVAVENQGRNAHKSFKIFILSVLILLTCRVMILLFFNFYGNTTGASAGGLSSMVYVIMLLSTLLIYAHAVRYGRSNPDLLLDTQGAELPRYQKSTLSAADLALYEQKMMELMEKDRVYLNNELSLQELATLLKVPKHYLTQVLNVRMKKGYHNYINSLRVAHACQLMRSRTNSSLQEIAMNSGFNSTVTFNRAFKTFKQMSPSEYLAQK